ncbi:thiamine-phosphate kinase [Helicobacter ailurogastricus]|uniref:Thiamine-monophosphate kinase n=1 Tax=Helicobacter ailurogastricus TaxID=1578720 RepID=A0A0K2X5G9_9HELI|nr:thiamine-phosphate kinase [Helicobacter ailurogastricus]CRF40773.1 Thiamine-monophosphate kinase [Helicobacter ailurogastricus]CRF41887.1 Thiamine-monophosphate kinase [Helicobacter ailurogastricus]CRF44970.1 Thiamine-monophosphate kinase [Helicobacter ailurogastricus]GLH58309.1 thiamine-monophosphate kinase [Helicobacter ailurogastricus]GLH60226.1 thiamine-monophosphate kinase [Helicobacter ailurogastricus]
MDLEQAFLKTLESSGVVWGLGDDGVRLDTHQCVYMLDLFSEGVHFKRGWLNCAQIGYKAVCVNVSDAIAMAACPKYALLGLQLPRGCNLAEIRQLVAGIAKACQEFKIKIVGGDTTLGKALSLSVTLIAKSPKPLERTKIRPKDLLVHTGKLGQSYKDLRALLRGGRVSPKSKFVCPKLQNLLKFILSVRPFVRAGLDISDGLLAECNRLSRLNKLACKLDKPYNKAYLSGEEYELLLSAPPRHKLALLRRAKQQRVQLNFVGVVCRGLSHYRPKIWHA